MTSLEAELRAWGIGKGWTPAQWAKYRAWAAKHPHGGMACNGDKPHGNTKKRSTSPVSIENPQNGTE